MREKDETEKDGDREKRREQIRQRDRQEGKVRERVIKSNTATDRLRKR